MKNAILLLIFLFPISVFAQELSERDDLAQIRKKRVDSGGYVVPKPSDPQASDVIIASDDFQSRDHIVGAFTGADWITPTSKFAPAFGLFYELRSLDYLGLGISARMIISDPIEYNIVLPMTFHVHPKLIFWVGYGIDFIASIPYNVDLPPGLQESQQKELTGNFFLRFGGGWRFMVKKTDPYIFLAPIVNFDLINVQDFYIEAGLQARVVL